MNNQINDENHHHMGSENNHETNQLKNFELFNEKINNH